MKQRLGLAVALLNGPDALILDEPANGLDPAGNRDFRQLLRELADEGRAVLLSSHQLSEVERACDRAVVLNRGAIVAEGRMAELVGGASWYQVRLGSDHYSTALALLAATHEVRPNGGEYLLVRTNSGQDVSRVLAQAGIFPDAIREHIPSLEERFLSLTERTDVR
jgi:ABC-2 type transport system ATP-binding protein